MAWNEIWTDVTVTPPVPELIVLVLLVKLLAPADIAVISWYVNIVGTLPSWSSAPEAFSVYHGGNV